jgi:hypothetical protein
MTELVAEAALVIVAHDRAEALATRLAEDPETPEDDFVAAAAEAYRLRLWRLRMADEFTRRRLAAA